MKNEIITDNIDNPPPPSVSQVIIMTQNDDKSSNILATSGGGGGGGGKGAARVIGSAVAGFTELALFHPVDTVAKRLMS